tara:strand:+ start:1120 stop:3273 length:2154 start_codon:yes stop_codon:yes gene_type:complete
MANGDFDWAEFALGMANTGAKVFETLAAVDVAKADMIHKEQVAMALEDKKQHNKIQLQNIKNEDAVNEGMFVANNKKIENLLKDASNHNILKDQIFKIDTDLDGKYAAGSEINKVLDSFGMSINNDLQFAFKTGTDINNHRHGIKEGIKHQNDIINLLDTRLNEVNKAIQDAESMDTTLGLDILDNVRDITDYEEYIQDNPEIFGYSGYADTDWSLTGEMPAQRPDFFMPTEDVGTEVSPGVYEAIPGKELEFAQQKEVYGEKEYLRLAILNNAPNTSTLLAADGAWAQLKDRHGYTDMDGVVHPSKAEREANIAKAETIEDRIEEINKQIEDKKAKENDSFELSMVGAFEELVKLEIDYSDSVGIQTAMNAGTRSFYTQTKQAKKFSDSPDEILKSEIDLVEKIGAMILQGLDKDLNPWIFGEKSYDTNAHIFRLFGADWDELGYDITVDQNIKKDWTGSSFGASDARRNWKGMDINKKRELVYNFYKMTMPTADELNSGNYKTNQFGGISLAGMDPTGTTTMIEDWPFAVQTDNHNINVSHAGYNFDLAPDEGGNAYYVNTGVPYIKEEITDINDSEVMSQYVIDGQLRVIAYDVDNNIVDANSPEAVKFEGVRKSRPGDPSAYWNPQHRVDLIESDFDWGNYDIVNNNWIGGDKVEDANVGNARYLVKMLEVWDILAKKSNSMNNQFLENLLINDDYINEVGLGGEWLYINPNE